MRAGRSSGPSPAPEVMLAQVGWKGLVLPLPGLCPRLLAGMCRGVGRMCWCQSKRPGSSLGTSGQGSVLAGGPPGDTEPDLTSPTCPEETLREGSDLSAGITCT